LDSRRENEHSNVRRTINPLYSAQVGERSAFGVRRSAFNVRRSPFAVHRSPFDVHRRSQDIGNTVTVLVHVWQAQVTFNPKVLPIY
jgi:hypothetical protein